ncbi:MAG: phosphoadenylyl-sulfate reductase [Cyanobacteria bacterium P01_A01_bin.135]
MTHATSQTSELKTDLNLTTINQALDQADAQRIVEWAADTFGDGLILSTSFGIQSAVMLNLVTQVIPDIPVIWVDTGYLPAKTYQFAEALTKRLNLNVKVYQPELSPARMEALHGQLWKETDLESLNLYDQIRKVEPMQRALQDFNVTAWLAGLRADQTHHRRSLSFVNQQAGIYKVLPILRWTPKDIYYYLKDNDLPYHPLYDEGYMTVGDWHSSRPITAADDDVRDTRFHGVKQECGLHLPKTIGEAESLDSSSL